MPRMILEPRALRPEVRREEEIELTWESLTTTSIDLVDEKSARVRSSQSYVVTDDFMWGQLSQDPAEIERLRTAKLETITDYAEESAHVFLTYSGAGGWDGEWLDLGGVAVALDVAALLREPVDLLDDADMAEYMGVVDIPVTIAVSGIDLVAPVTLPAAASIVTEAPPG